MFRTSNILAAFLAVLFLTATATAQDTPPSLPEPPEAPEPPAWDWDKDDPRIGLKAGLYDAEEAAWNVELLATIQKPEGFRDEDETGGTVSNTDVAFQGDLAFVGNYRGFNIYDVSDSKNPVLRSSVVCPGGQGDLSVVGDLLIMSVEEGRGRIDCGIQGVAEAVSAERFRGIRLFDISDLDVPRQVAAVQACRGSHTHTVLTSPSDAENLYVYIQGTGDVRSGEELAGCVSAKDPDDDSNTSYFRIEVVKVPYANPELAEVVSMPRIFENKETGEIAGLWRGGDHGPDTQETSETNQCHDITVYPEIGLAAGACSGNGILLDISDPVNPVRIDEVADENFAYWHSATFNNDGTKVIFTDEWGGGRGARCQSMHRQEWGADAIFELRDRKLHFEGYYKLPVPQTATENCVAHNGSIVPVPGRDIKVQAWYQGGLSMFDFTDPANPQEIAFFDRGPISDTEAPTGGYWSTYWHNGRIYGTEIVRGFDIFDLTPSEHLSANEIEAAKLVSNGEFNAQNQPRIDWPAVPVVAKAYVDQLVRAGEMAAGDGAALSAQIDGGSDMNEAAATLEADALAALTSGHSGNSDRIRARLASTLRNLER